MPHNRFFVDAPLKASEEIFLMGEEAHHLQRVMRKQEGESVELVNGRNQLASAKITTCEKKRVRLQILHVDERSSSTIFPLILCQAIPRLNRLDTLVEKGTELGMTELWLFPGQLSEKKEVPLHRLKAISIAAMKQCGRLDLPRIVLKPPLDAWGEQKYPAYFGDISEKAPPFLSIYQKKEGILFFIGPESGFTQDEERHLRHVILAQGVSLHPYILRTDTAPLVALSLIMN
jgi:16S rRNA (uracil1498-N3)-methyltransferase